MAEKKKALIVTTVSGFVPQFEINNVNILQNMGYEVHYASNFQNVVYGTNNTRLDGTGIIKHQINFERSPYHLFKNLNCFRELKGLLNKEHFSIVHCHTPMGGVLARLAVESVRKERERRGNILSTFVIYTAHGFHFYKGAPISNWLFYYPVEKQLAKLTDILITINNEDYRIAERFPIRKGGSVVKINGVGITLDKSEKNKEILKNSAWKQYYKVPNDKEYIVSVGELTKRKNHQVVIRALARLKKKYKKQNKQLPFYYIICGSGERWHKLQRLIKKNGLEEDVYLLGYFKPVKEILLGALLFVFPSLQEGLPVALLEAMEVGLPIICSKIRGNIDLIQDQKGGYLIKDNNPKEYENKIEELIYNTKMRLSMGNWNKMQSVYYDIEQVGKKMEQIYRKIDY